MRLTNVIGRCYCDMAYKETLRLVWVSKPFVLILSYFHAECDMSVHALIVIGE